MNPTNASASTATDVAVIGAGPYGLAAAAHIRGSGLDMHLFGDPMGFWKTGMPAGMFLRSPWQGSHISDPDRSLTLDAFAATGAMRRTAPIPIADFIAYGEWFQSRVAPDLDRRRVVRIDRRDTGFSLELDEGSTYEAARVVLATGPSAFAYRPQQFDGLPRRLASHSSEHDDLSEFAGKRVLVVGGGQSALECAVLMHESQADVEILIRSSEAFWLEGRLRRGGLRSSLLSAIHPLRRRLDPPSAVGPFPQSWLVELPDVFRRLPIEQQENVARRALRAGGASWLRPRTETMRITTGRAVVRVEPGDDDARALLDDETYRTLDHILLATGYRVDLSRLPYMTPHLLGSISQRHGYPVLDDSFQTSVPGLYVLGSPAAHSFGPLMRFVWGAGYASKALTRGLRRS